MRAAILNVSAALLRSKLQLPDSTTVLRIEMSVDCDDLRLLIEDPMLPEVRPGARFPVIQAELTSEGFARYIG